MQPHLICLDLDGTLLNDNKEISSYTKQVLNELQQRGHQIMIATGRPYRASQMYYHELNLTTPIVNFNGAYVHHPKDKNFKTCHEILDLGIAQNIIQGLQQYQVSNIIA
ncbi:TPA: HAD-IIB family hydrolase, partial [Staphylococcus aureus]